MKVKAIIAAAAMTFAVSAIAAKAPVDVAAEKAEAQEILTAQCVALDLEVCPQLIWFPSAFRQAWGIFGYHQETNHPILGLNDVLYIAANQSMQEAIIAHELTHYVEDLEGHEGGHGRSFIKTCKKISRAVGAKSHLGCKESA